MILSKDCLLADIIKYIYIYIYYIAIKAISFTISNTVN